MKTRTSARRRAVIAAVVLMGASRLQAQTLPLPVIPAPTPTALEGASAPAPSLEPARHRPWEYVFGLAAGYDSNVDFLPEGPGDAVMTPRGEFARVFHNPRGQFRIRGAGGGFVYLEQVNRNRVDADVGLDGTRSLSPNATLAADGSVGIGHTDSDRLLNEQGVLLPLSRTRAFRGSVNLDWRPGARGSVQVDLRASGTDFEDPQYVDSSSLRGSVILGHRLGDRSSAFAQYSIERSRSDFSYLTHFGSLQWSRLLSRRSALLLEGGVSRSDSSATSGAATSSFFGGASFARQLGRSSVILFARREVIPAFGVGGLRVADRFGLRSTIPMGRVWELALTASHVERSVPEGYVGDQATSDDAMLALGRTLGRRLRVAAEARYRRRGPDGTIPAVESAQGRIVVSFTSPQAEGR